MNPRNLLITTLVATTGLFAQEPETQAPEGLPNPKPPHHAALEQWAGTWALTGKADAMPGVPGMEEPTESSGTETAALVCNGLWLKWESVVNHGGQQSTGLWLVGYDPFQEQYVSYSVSSDDQWPGLNRVTGTHDAETNVWTWIGDTAEGKFKSVCEFVGADRMKETIYSVAPDGEETQFMVMSRVRSKDTTPASIVNASHEAPEGASRKPLAALLRDVGAWDAVVENDCAGETTVDKASETVDAICGGRWTLTEFHSTYLGTPFSGHALVGWNSKEKRYESVWIDSMSATPCTMTGTFDEKTKTFSFTGTCTGPDGKPMKATQSLVCAEDDSRVMHMEFEHPEMSSKMKITYTRRAR